MEHYDKISRRFFEPFFQAFYIILLSMGSTFSQEKPQFGEISSIQLFNQLQNIRIWTIIFDVRNDSNDVQPTIDGAHKSIESMIKEIDENSRVKCEIVLCGEHNEIISTKILSRCQMLKKSYDNLKSISILSDGYSNFANKWPFMCTDHPNYEQGRLYPSKIESSDDKYPHQCLYLSSYALANDAVILQQLQITHVVNVTPDHPHCNFGENMEVNGQPIKFFRVPIVDEVTSRLDEWLDEVVAFMEQATLEKGKILIHCRHGQSRSAAVLCGFLMKTRGWGFSESMELLSECRPAVNPNAGFREQLLTWRVSLGASHKPSLPINKPNDGDGSVRGGGGNFVSTMSSNSDKTCSEEFIEIMKERVKSLQPEGEEPLAILVLPGSLNPVHKGHLECLEVAKKHLQSKGIRVIGGFLQPSSDRYVSHKLGELDAMDLYSRIQTCSLAAEEHQQELEEKHHQVDPFSSWISVWRSGDANGMYAVGRCAKHVEDHLKLPVKGYLVCGADFAESIGWGAFKINCPVVVISREGIDSPEIVQSKDWYLASVDSVNSSSSTKVRQALKEKNWDQLKSMLHRSVFEVMKAKY